MAGVRFRGDDSKLKALQMSFAELSRRKFRQTLNKKLAETALDLAHDGFDRSITPYGKRWKNPKYRNGKPLLDTGRLRLSIRPRSSADGFELATNVIYAATHEFGRGPIPQRQFLPIGSQGFGGRWRKALEEVAKREVDSVLGR